MVMIAMTKSVAVKLRYDLIGNNVEDIPTIIAKTIVMNKIEE